VAIVEARPQSLRGRLSDGAITRDATAAPRIAVNS